MEALGLIANKEGIQKFEVEKPSITAANQVLIKTITAAIDGTDRAIVKYNLFDPPAGEEFMILGHEAVGRVVEVGSEVKSLAIGDIVVPTVRHGCGRCASCLHNQSDMCFTGLYTEHGIHKLHGFFREYVVDEEENLVKVPAGLEKLAVLTEPLSICEKGIESIKYIQNRLPWACPHPHHRYDSPGWGSCKKGLVIGVGPLGFLATALLIKEGVHTYAVINRPETNHKVKLVQEMGGHYIDGRTPDYQQITKLTGPLDIVIESSGISQLALDLVSGLGRNGIYVFTGIPRGHREVCLDGNSFLRQVVRYNQVVIGSVNSNRSHFEAALKDLAEFREIFGTIFDQIITHRFKISEYQQAFAAKDPEQLKVVFDFEDSD